MHRSLYALATSIALVAALSVGAAAAGAAHSPSRPHGPGFVRDLGDGRPQDGQAGQAGQRVPDSPSANSVLQFGPFPSGSPDSGTCGNNWATDTFDRFFTVVPNGDGTGRVVEFFKDASFLTLAGPSPGACENGATPHMVTAGIPGRFQGYFLISVSNGTLNRSATCTAAASSCGTTAGFIKTVFGTGATFEVTTFLFNYSSSDQTLISRHWKNASEDRGGNLGDIRTS